MWWNIAEAAGPSTVFLSQTNNNLLILSDLSSPLPPPVNTEDQETTRYFSLAAPAR